ncbi:VanZ family protein [Haloarcula nitratireducens]|uniref:VanZ family protein n=1 Tax=Haloarcula nitratireducens TaxID=2487749 RepID=A0AAW4PBJ1_9EURY|nr:VanZ family protein [Halomicroarcula nitratireducens]MBX0294958.1 VanZ family protein [Halomicroarcula nitratireducens]
MTRTATRRHLPAIAFAVVLLVTSLLPTPESAGGQIPALLGISPDKWVHAFSYGALTGLLAWGRTARRVTVVAALAGIAVAYGAGIELLQGLVPSRGTSWLDFLANAVGAALAGAAWLWYRR